MTQSAVPNATRSLGAWLFSGATRMHFCIDEGVDTPDEHTTYGYTSSDNDPFQVGLANTITDPATHWGHQVRLRMGKFGGGVNSLTMPVVALYQETTLIATATGPGGNLAGGYATYTYTFDPADVAALANYNLAEIRVTSGTWSIVSGTPEMRVTALDFETPDVGAMMGTASAVGSAAATLVGAGALAGTAAAAGSAAGTLAGAGALAGTATADSSADGTLGGIGALAGTAASSSSVDDATLTGAGALAGVAAAVASASGTMAGTGVLAGTARAESHAVLFHDPTPPKHMKLMLPNEGIADAPIWTLMILDLGKIEHLLVENDLDVRLAGKFGTSGTDPEFFVEPGRTRIWKLTDSPVRGPVYVRGASSDPTDGSVTAEVIYR